MTHTTKAQLVAIAAPVVEVLTSVIRVAGRDLGQHRGQDRADEGNDGHDCTEQSADDGDELAHDELPPFVSPSSPLRKVLMVSAAPLIDLSDLLSKR